MDYNILDKRSATKKRRKRRLKVNNGVEKRTGWARSEERVKNKGERGEKGR